MKLSITGGSTKNTFPKKIPTYLASKNVWSFNNRIGSKALQEDTNMAKDTKV